jgi:lipopolysaccharide/colanic/teichoic acid biosynthesis glycosyltransferase
MVSSICTTPYAAFSQPDPKSCFMVNSVVAQAGSPAVAINPCVSRFRYRIVKRAADTLLAVIGLFVAAPLFLLVSAVIKLTSGSPVFYEWHVVGLGGKEFTGYKFRTMTPGAESLEKQMAVFNERRGPGFKMTNDPRVTRIGVLLRRFSLDELPQLWSILRGDMSFVGPRPLKPREFTEMSGWHREKFSVLPGAVSLWHVSGQPPAFDDWVRMDLEYIRSWSLQMDMTILCKGLVYVLLGRNK